MEWVHDHGGEAKILDTGNEVRFWDGRPLTLDGDAGYRYLSLVPLDRTITGVRLRGVKYPLTNATLTRGDTLSISNEVSGPQAVLSADTGRMLVIRSQKYTEK